MKLRQVALLPTTGTAPPELLVGKVTEVWAEDGHDLLSAHRRWHAARRAWEAQSGLTPDAASRLLPGGSPWSAQYLIEAGHEAWVHDFLARSGARLDQLEELRRRAERWDQSPTGGVGAPKITRRGAPDPWVGGSQLAHPEMNRPTDGLPGVLATPGEGDT